MNDAERGTGRTTKQMAGAPQGGIFVWCNGVTSYARDLAAHLKRGDLRILPASAFERGASALRGYERGTIVVDHAFDVCASDEERRGRRIATEQGII